MRTELAAVCLAAALMVAMTGFVQSQTNTNPITTLFCQDDKFPEFQYYLDFDESSKLVFGVQSGRITSNTIEFEDVIKGTKYKTIIYRTNGRFIVFASGTTNGNFSGQCTVKPKNIF
jgi:hypothetical protein